MQPLAETCLSPASIHAASHHGLVHPPTTETLILTRDTKSRVHVISQLRCVVACSCVCSVTKQEIVDAIYQQTGRSIADMELTVPDIKTLGTYECSVKLHPDVTATFNILIQKEKNVQQKGGRK